MKEYNTFSFDKYIYDKDKSLLRLYYSIEDLEFVEEINFNPSNIKLRELNKEEENVLDLSFAYLHLIAGISYYKLFCCKNIEIKTISLSKEQKEFFDKVYLYGLGEFACRNNLDLRNIINFPYTHNENKPIYLELQDNFIVPIGGGKDSIVSLEILQTIKDQKLYTFAVNTAKPIEECCKLSNCEHIQITRKLSPLLFEINENIDKYKAYNGHIPITMIIAFISVSAGILYNCNTTIISNESSANVGNILHNGIFVNHQWSKSFEAEEMIHNFIHQYITPTYNYFSLLRPIYEIHIAKLFSQITKYHSVFASCNKNFKILKDFKQKQWCCDCDKCRFVYLILSPFIKKNKLINIFGNNLLDNNNQLIGYQELVGLSGHKPFECVGEIEESILAFYLLQNTEFKDDFIVKNIMMEINKKYSIKQLEDLKSKYLSYNFESTLLDEKFKKIFLNYIDKIK